MTEEDRDQNPDDVSDEDLETVAGGGQISVTLNCCLVQPPRAPAPAEPGMPPAPEVPPAG